MDKRKTIVLFDQDLQHYRISIYEQFAEWFDDRGTDLRVYSDKDLSTKNDGIFKAISYDLKSFKNIVRKDHPSVVIQFVWLRYKFVFPFMLWMRFIRTPVVVWSHGINLQAPRTFLRQAPYFLRQFLANALILYTKNELKFVKASHKKTFIANNTLDWSTLPTFDELPSQLKKSEGLEGKFVILSVARFGVNNRNIDHLINLSEKLDVASRIVIIGSGILERQLAKILEAENMVYLGEIYDQEVVSRWYAIADVFVMPGAIGLAINQAFHYGTPVVLFETQHGPEAYYLRTGKNGEYYKDENDLAHQIKKIQAAPERYSKGAIRTMQEEGSLEKMFEGFIMAIEYVEQRRA